MCKEILKEQTQVRTMKSSIFPLISWGAAAAAWMARTAHAVQDLPGGPAVQQLNLHPPVTRIAQEQHFLHWMMLAICAVIFVGVFAVMFYSIWKHRKSQGAKAANFHESATVEVIWTVIPFIIVILIALPATKVLVAQKDTTNAELTIKATGYQWKWGYDYLKGPGEGLSFLSSIDSPPSIIFCILSFTLSIAALSSSDKINSVFFTLLDENSEGNNASIGLS